MPTKLGHILETQQFKDRKLLDELYSLADDMRLFDKPNPTEEDLKRCKELSLPQEPRRKILVSAFYQESTRTRWSFEAGMISLGGQYITSQDVSKFSGEAKGEKLPDTIRVSSGYGDVIVIRHPVEGAANMAARYSRVPVINGGDGTGQHPTQALLDLYTIEKERGKEERIKVGMIGDLKNGRTVRSLTYLLANHYKPQLYLMSPEQLKMRHDIIEFLTDHGTEFHELPVEELIEVAKGLDVLYVTRVQTNLDPTAKEMVGSYIVDRRTIDVMPSNSIVMHPLPNAGELDFETYQDPRVIPIKQSDNGKYVRMALLKMILDGS